jgi:hypothetical protein
MPRRYLKRTRHFPWKMRHLKRVWTSASVPAAGQDAPAAGAAYPVAGVNNPWRINIIADAPNWVTSWAVTIKQKVISTGVAGADIVPAFTVIANQTRAQIATAVAAGLRANVLLACPAPAAGQAQCDVTLVDPLNQITSVFVGASSNVAPVIAVA